MESLWCEPQAIDWSRRGRETRYYLRSIPVMHKHTVTYKLVCRCYQQQAVTGHSWNGPIWRRIDKNVIEYCDSCSMSLATTGVMVIIHTTRINIKKLWSFTAETRVRFRTRTRGNCFGYWDRVLTEYFGFNLLRHPANAPHSRFVHLHSRRYTPSNWWRR